MCDGFVVPGDKVPHSGYMHNIFMGAVGVDAFFVLSSFLLTMIFMKKTIKLIAEAVSYRKWAYTLLEYFSKRFFRVYPLFALLSITPWLMPFEYKNQYYLVRRPEDFNLFQTLTFHPEHRHYLLWTLPLKISYYFILPAFVLTEFKMGRLCWLYFTPLYTWIVHEGLYTTRDNFYRQPLSKHLPTFVAGSMAAVIFVKLQAWIKAAGFYFRMPHTIGLRAIEAVLTAAYLQRRLSWLVFQLAGCSTPTRHQLYHAVHERQVVAVDCDRDDSAVHRVANLEWVVLRYLGKISFSVYILHVFVIFTKPIKEQINYYDRMFSIFGLVLLLATASYHLVEHPSQLLAPRISRKLASLAPNDHQQIAEHSDTDSEEGDPPQDF